MNAEEIQALIDEANQKKAELAAVDAQVTAELKGADAQQEETESSQAAVAVADQSDNDEDLSDVQDALDAQLNNGDPTASKLQLRAAEGYRAADMGNGGLSDEPLGSVASELAEVQSALGTFYSENEDGDEDIDARIARVANHATKKIRLTMLSAMVLSALAVAGVVYHSIVLSSTNAKLMSANNRLVQRCHWHEARIALGSGQQVPQERPLWYRHWNVLDLDREFIGQVPTLAGIINVVRSRPTSVNNRTDFNFQITNPMSIDMCGGKLILRTSLTAYDHRNDHNYELLRQFYGSLTQLEYSIGDLEPGQTRALSIELPRIEDQPPPAYVDFEIVFDYFKPIDQSQFIKTDT